MVFKNGFSLVEVVIVIGLISILASLGLFFSLGYYNVYVLNAETDLLATLFKKTRTRAIGNFNQSRHGVFVDSINRQYIVFQGNSFAARDPVFDEVVGEMDLSEDDFEPEIVPNPDGKKQHKKPEREFISSKILADGRLVEMIYNEQSRETKLAVFDGDSVNYVDEIGIYKPYSPANHLINKKVIRFSSEAKEYNSEKELIEEIQKFIHKYLDISSFFEKIAAYYVLFSWIYD
ncbi:MAG: hypothetical protein UU61_C0027G0001, partial [Parcubacteria group bacterium GW2011_GWB1_41_4]